MNNIKKTPRVGKSKNLAPLNYKNFLEEVKTRIRNAQVKAALSVNSELIKLYWSIGKDLIERQNKSGWGNNVLDKLSKDLQNDFPGVEGFSRSNLFRMKAFYTAYEKVAQPVRQLDELPFLSIPWGHNIILLQKLKDTELRLWYAHKTIENGWSRNALERWISTGLHKRQGKAITNFKHTLSQPHSDLAEQSLKNPYSFDFLTLGTEAKEREIELNLVAHVQQVLLELGDGFAFIGRQYHIKVCGEDHYLDMLFYNFKLSCFVVIELKARDFDPKDTGQANFYLSAVDSQLKRPEDKPSIGILLYYTEKKQKKIKVEYALRNVKSALAVSTILVKSLPKQLKSSLPSVKELEEELESGLKTIEPND